MCLRPVSIKNSKPDKVPFVDHTQLRVPCNHCTECKQNKKDSWFVRLYYEYEYTKFCKGWSVYITLTYNNKFVPRYITPERELLCFRSSDIQKYVKRVREHLTRRFPEYNWARALKYFCASEYGSKTHRPHEHMLFFIPFPVKRTHIYRIIKIIRECWHCGFTKQGKGGWIVNGLGGIKYCAKYVCKDAYDDSYIAFLLNKYKDVVWDFDEFKKALTPFVLSSNYLGCSFLNDVDINTLEGTIYLPDTLLGVRPYKLPQYYERKLFYDVKYKYFDVKKKCYCYVDNRSDVPSTALAFSPTYVLNSDGVAYNLRRQEFFIDSLRDSYTKFMLLANEDYIEKLNAHFDTTYKSLKSFQAQVRLSFDINKFVDYNLCYNNLFGASPSADSDVVVDTCRCYNDILDLRAGVNRCYDFDNIKRGADYYNNSQFNLLNDMIHYVLFLSKLPHSQKIEEEEFKYSDRKSVYLSNL